MKKKKNKITKYKQLTTITIYVCMYVEIIIVIVVVKVLKICMLVKVLQFQCFKLNKIRFKRFMFLLKNNFIILTYVRGFHGGLKIKSSKR